MLGSLLRDYGCADVTLLRAHPWPTMTTTGDSQYLFHEFYDDSDGTFIVRDGERYHIACDAKLAKKCDKCSELLNGRYLTLNDGKNMHPDCFKCANKDCGSSLESGYVGKEDGNHVCKKCNDATSS